MQLAQGRCRYHLHNETDAQDISQSVMIELLLNYQKIEKPEAWIIGTSRNKCYEFMRKNIAYRRMLGRLEAEMQLISDIELQELSRSDKVPIEKLVVSIPPENISKQDQDFFMEYINCGCDLEYLQNKFELNYESSRKRLYNIRRDISAWINQQRGVVRGIDRIIGGHLNKNILNFLDRFQQCTIDNNWQSLIRYLAADVVIPQNFTFPFYEEREYQVYFMKQNSFKVVITHFSKNREVSGYFFHIKLVPPNSDEPKPKKRRISTTENAEGAEKEFK